MVCLCALSGRCVQSNLDFDAEDARKRALDATRIIIDEYDAMQPVVQSLAEASGVNVYPALGCNRPHKGACVPCDYILCVHQCLTWFRHPH